MHWRIFLLMVSLCSLLRAVDIEGFVKFPGETPPPKMIGNGSDEACPHGIAQNHLLVRQENRGLKNALVMMDYEGDAPEIKAKPAGLKSEGCTLLPRVQWVPMPAYVTVTNLDPTSLELEATLNDVRMFHIQLDGQNANVRRPLTTAGFYLVTSASHPWMRAWIYASPHPYVAVTDAMGHFLIQKVLPGKVTLHAWHEGWTVKRKDKNGGIEYQPVEEVHQVRVPSDGTINVIFEHLEPTF
jgi:hypothetical protein